MYAYKNEWTLLLYIDVKVPTIQRKLFRLESFGAKETRHRLCSKVSARLRKVTHRKTVWQERWVWSQSQRHLYMISVLNYRPKITSIVFADNYENFSTRSQLHNPTVGIPRSPFAFASKMRAPRSSS